MGPRAVQVGLSVQRMPEAPARSLAVNDLTARERELLDATVEVLDERGYDRLTVDEVAARARASKATIYRRWPSKQALIIAAILAHLDARPFEQRHDGMSFRDELLQVVRYLATEGLEMRATIAATLGETIRNAELRASIEEHLIKPRRDSMRGMLERRRAAGEVRDGVDLEFAGAIPSAIIYQRLLVTHEPVDDALTERIVDELVLPLLT